MRSKLNIQSEYACEQRESAAAPSLIVSPRQILMSNSSNTTERLIFSSIYKNVENLMTFDYEAFMILRGLNFNHAKQIFFFCFSPQMSSINAYVEG